MFTLGATTSLTIARNNDFGPLEVVFQGRNFRLESRKNVNYTKAQVTQLPQITITHDDQLMNIEGIPDKKGYSSEFSLKILTSLGCTASGKTKMSQRVRGNSKKVPIVYSKFYSCDPTEVEHVVTDLKE